MHICVCGGGGGEIGLKYSDGNPYINHSDRLIKMCLN